MKYARKARRLGSRYRQGYFHPLKYMAMVVPWPDGVATKYADWIPGDRRKGGTARESTGQSCETSHGSIGHQTGASGDLSRMLLEYDRACRDAARDLRALGFRPSAQMILGYVIALVFAPSPFSWKVAELKAILRAAREPAENPALKHLPFPVPRVPRPEPSRPLTPAEERRWRQRALREIDLSFRRDPRLYWEREVRSIIEVRLVHEHAVAQRERYLRLLNLDALPSKIGFLNEFAERSTTMLSRREHPQEPSPSCTRYA